MVLILREIYKNLLDKSITEIVQFIESHLFKMYKSEKLFNKEWQVIKFTMFYKRDNFSWDLKYYNFDTIIITKDKRYIKLWDKHTKLEEEYNIELTNRKLFTWEQQDTYNIFITED